MRTEAAVLSAFRAAARQVPAYARILADRGVRPENIRNLDDFRAQIPIVDKKSTFGTFPLPELCRGGRLGRPASVLTSSGHSGRFAFGLYDADGVDAQIAHTDESLDALFGVRSRTTLLVNCLPMGVKVFTRACTLADTSVRADMVIALVRELGACYDQIILVGETAFIKHALELGQCRGVPWRDLLVHVIVGEEPLAENARAYLQGILGCDPRSPQKGIVGSSMGVAELGLNLFFELPHLAILRRAIHENQALRQAFLGAAATNVPMLFTYDPARIFVEVLDDGRLVVTTLDPHRPIPLIRYETGDVATALGPRSLEPILRAASLPGELFGDLPLIMIHGRGQSVRVGDVPVYPEQVKEGLYAEASLAGLTTANFRLKSDASRAVVRIQLSLGVEPEPDMPEKFAAAMARYVPAPLAVRCEPYAQFGSGMSLDYERKFDYLGDD